MGIGQLLNTEIETGGPFHRVDHLFRPREAIVGAITQN